MKYYIKAIKSYKNKYIYLQRLQIYIKYGRMKLEGDFMGLFDRFKNKQKNTKYCAFSPIKPLHSPLILFKKTAGLLNESRQSI